jgi:hypothetical protein
MKDRELIAAYKEIGYTVTRDDVPYATHLYRKRDNTHVWVTKDGFSFLTKEYCEKVHGPIQQTQDRTG